MNKSDKSRRTSVYEYVSPVEYKSVVSQISGIFQKVHSEMESRHGIRFRSKLVGSASRKMVTRRIGGNTGFDLDYNFIVLKVPHGYKPKDLKEDFRNAFRKALKDTKYSDSEDSESVLTVKMVDKGCKRIVHSFDIAIFINFGSEENPDLKYIFHDKGLDRFLFLYRGGDRDFSDKEQWIKSHTHWNEVLDEYLLLKNTNEDLGKHSFNLYAESVSNVYNHYHQDSGSKNKQRRR